MFVDPKNRFKITTPAAESSSINDIQWKVNRQDIWYDLASVFSFFGKGKESDKKSSIE